MTLCGGRAKINESIRRLSRRSQFVFAGRCLRRVAREIEKPTAVSVEIVAVVHRILSGDRGVDTVKWRDWEAPLLSEAEQSEDLEGAADLLELAAEIVGMMSDPSSAMDGTIGAAELSASFFRDALGEQAHEREREHQRKELEVLLRLPVDASIRDATEALDNRFGLR